jgi:phosphohistidine phosphatase SixA
MRPLAPRSTRPRGRVLRTGLLAVGLGLSLFLVAGSLASPPGIQAGAAAEKKLGSTIIFVRHAEKDPSGDAKDPGLGDAGKKRAAALARLLSHAGVTRLYASEYKRAQATLEPLAQGTGLKIEVVPATDSGRLIAALAGSAPGSVSVVAGHSNTIPGLFEKLGGHASDLVSTPQGPQLRETEFDRLFVLTLGPAEKAGDPPVRAAVSTLELRYGD